VRPRVDVEVGPAQSVVVVHHVEHMTNLYDASNQREKQLLTRSGVLRLIHQLTSCATVYAADSPSSSTTAQLCKLEHIVPTSAIPETKSKTCYFCVTCVANTLLKWLERNYALMSASVLQPLSALAAVIIALL